MSLRGGLNDLVERDGEVQESKFFAVIGKSICVYIMLAFAEKLIQHEYVLMILLLALIAPDLLKKFLSMRFGAPEPQGVKTVTTMTAPATIKTTTTEPPEAAARKKHPLED